MTARRTRDARPDAGPAALPYETIALVLQGGGALGSYQAGVFEGLHEAGVALDWIAGISIGALNTALIAGNAPEHRVQRLRAFWERICQPAFFPAVPQLLETVLFNNIDQVRELFTASQAASAMVQGQQGFFVPRFPPPMPGAVAERPDALSWYDTSPLRDTLLEFCDFDRINSGSIRVSIGAVDIETGNFVYFDTARDKLMPEHFMASGALPPAFAPVEIDGRYYWDGGVVSNTPLMEVLGAEPRRDTLAFQVDLWSAQGPLPRSMADVAERQKDIQYSSRTRLVTDAMQREQRYRNMLHHLLEQIPQARRKTDPKCVEAEKIACGKKYNVQHLIYREKAYDQHYKDYQFGLSTMQDHWAAGLSDIRKTLAVKDGLAPPANGSGFVTRDIHRTSG